MYLGRLLKMASQVFERIFFCISVIPRPPLDFSTAHILSKKRIFAEQNHYEEPLPQVYEVKTIREIGNCPLTEDEKS